MLPPDQPIGRAGRLPRALAAALAVGWLLTAAAQAMAQSSDQRYDSAKQFGAVSVRDADRTADKPDGIRVGNFIVQPEIAAAATWLDNIFAKPTNLQSDRRDELDVRAKVTSDLPRHMFEVMAGARTVAFRRYSETNHTDVFSNGLFRLDINHGHNIFGSFGFESTREENVEEEAPENARRPVALVRGRAELGVKRDVGKVSLAAGARAQTWNYRDVENFAGSLIEQDHRDLTIFSPFVRAAYRPSPGYRLFTDLYSHRHSTRGIGHDGTGYEAAAGIEFELTPLLQIAVKAGRYGLDMADEQLARVSVPTWDAGFQWFATSHLTLTGSNSRNLLPTSIAEASARLETRYTLGAEYEASRNLLFTIHAEYLRNTYVGVPQTDTLWRGRLGTEYYFSKNWLFTILHEYRFRANSFSEVGVQRNALTAGVKYRY